MTGIGLSLAVLNGSEYESLPQGEASNASVHESSADSSGKKLTQSLIAWKYVVMLVACFFLLVRNSRFFFFFKTGQGLLQEALNGSVYKSALDDSDGMY